MKNIEYSELKMQEYLSSNCKEITKDQSIKIFQLRTRMSNVKTNYKNKYQSLLCDLCFKTEESQEHLLDCEILGEKCEIQYSELWNGSSHNKLEIMKAFYTKLEKKEQIIKSL